jgi:hypothetical protein
MRIKLLMETLNVYCDESCHLQRDGSDIMALGAVWCPESRKNEIFERIREIKFKHNLKPVFNKNNHFHKPEFEIKWNKVSNTKLDFYKELVDFFFDDDDLHFRVLIVPDKTTLDLSKYNLTHDAFYYRMYFDMLKVILNPEFCHNIYLDIKDTKSTETVNELTKVLRNNHYDYSHRVIKKIQQVRSHEIELLQLTDLLIGAISYVHRNLSGNKAKVELIEKIKHRSKYSLTKSTLVKERKFNIFVWKSSYMNNNN